MGLQEGGERRHGADDDGNIIFHDAKEDLAPERGLDSSHDLHANEKARLIPCGIGNII